MQTKPVVSRAKAYLKVRHKAVRDAMKQLKLDGLLLTHPPDLAYLTNFTGDDSVGLITEKGFYLATDFRYQEQAEIEAGWLSIHIKENRIVDTIAKMIKETKADRVGFEANFTTFGQIDAIDRSVKELKKGSPNGDSRELQLVPLEDVLVNIRKVKDDNEIDLVRKSIDIAQQAFEAIRPEIQPGQTENWLAGQLIAELRSRGASGTSFPPIIAAGANSSLPHYRPGEKEVTLLKDQPVLIDWGGVYRGYCSDMTRMIMLGRVSPKIKEIYKIVLEAHDAAIAFLRPGVTTLQADRVARDIIEKAGYGKEFGHGLGHGLGRDIHELPRVSKWTAEEELRHGMIVTVEPGIYIPGEGGVRIEDDVLITHSNHEVLSTLDRSFEGCHFE
ncbi:MAG TPA: Xaa-Pro peptidase family protein [Tepidisphaeraceae bacterium]|jgi:Xaa-Pro aminopeptidase|nr:Xaa-Pro peptidase family protein [Tepidisphaeraceae bacterium]